ncbi:N-acetyltransferase [Spirochaetia bacterium]|nr:N-acetyltransferase [Spirochaetia bacterium]
MILISSDNFNEYFTIEKLSPGHPIDNFNGDNPNEYTLFFKQDALKHQESHISNTFVLVDKITGDIAAYISLIADAVTLQEDEKEQLQLPAIFFETLPALKIAKLAVSQLYTQKYRRLGSLMIDFARNIADQCNEKFIACRVLTVDADIEYNKELPVFYEKRPKISEGAEKTEE